MSGCGPLESLPQLLLSRELGTARDMSFGNSKVGKIDPLGSGVVTIERNEV